MPAHRPKARRSSHEDRMYFQSIAQSVLLLVLVAFTAVIMSYAADGDNTVAALAADARKTGAFEAVTEAAQVEHRVGPRLLKLVDHIEAVLAKAEQVEAETEGAALHLDHAIAGAARSFADGLE